MVRITEELVRKKSEHNEGIIGTLEELSLHQEDVEKIENLNNWCKELQILYLQANLISKIENLNKLKKLQYLNLAVNNIEKIENLERCESLEKLDLTLNFIGDLESIKCLKNNSQLRSLYLTGNPCCQFEGYRDYVVATLPQITSLDVKEITRGERIKAMQNIVEIEKKIRKSQEDYRQFREAQKLRQTLNDSSRLTDEEFWKSTSENSPEARAEISRRQRRNRPSSDTDGDRERAPRTTRLYDKNGRPLNVNQAKLPFTFCDERRDAFVLDVAVYKYLDTSLIDVDLQPSYVRLTVKGKVFQIVFPEEVMVEKSTARRSQTTGHLVLELFKANYKPLRTKPIYNVLPRSQPNHKECVEEEIDEYRISKKETAREYLETDQGKKDDMDFSKIVENNENPKKRYEDNPEVPPLEYG